MDAHRPHQDNALTQASRSGSRQNSNAFELPGRLVASARDQPSIDGMLRNGTEIGLLTRLSPKLDHSAHQTIVKGGIDPGHSGPGIHSKSPENNIGLGTRDASMLNSRPSRQAQYENLMPVGPAYLTMPHKLYNGHVLNRQHIPLASHQNRGLPSHGRPRSPFTYPTRLKRPGYRPSSPAWSDANQASRHPNFDFRPSSPLSMNAINHLPAPWIQQHIHSDSPGQPSPDLSRTTTPRNASSIRSNRSTKLVHHEKSQSSLRGNKITHIEAPLFYDYSEGFEDIHQCARSQDISDSEQSSSRVSKMKTSTQSLKPFVEDPPPQTAVGAHPRRGDVNLQNQLPPDILLDNSPAFRAETPKPQTAQSQARRPPKSISNGGTIDNGQDGIEDTISPPTELGSNSTPGAELLKRIYVRELESCSSLDSMQTAESSLKQEMLTDSGELDLSAIRPSSETVQVSESKVNGDRDSLRTVIRKDSTHEDLSPAESSKIISPTPERSILSEINRHRFSRILGDSNSERVGGHSLELRPVLVCEIDKSRPVSSNVAMEQPQIVSSGGVRTDFATIDDSGSDGAPQLSASLIRTFGRPKNYVESEEQAQDLQYTERKTSNRSATPKETPFGTISPASQSFFGLEDGRTEPVVSGTRDFRLPSVRNKNRHARIIGHSVDDKPELAELASLGRRPAVITISPPMSDNKRSLPFNFVPFNANTGEETTISSVSAITKGSMDDHAFAPNRRKDLDICVAQDLLRASDKDSIAPSRVSRPWNRDSNYPWNEESLKLDVALPAETRPTTSPAGRFPKFKLRVHRASTSSAGTGKLAKSRSSSNGVTSSSRNSLQSTRQRTVFKSKAKPKLGTGPSQENSSHALGDDTLRSRFVETFDSPPQFETEINSPTITLVPVSPNHEVHSCFSDDSSRTRPKVSLRKRLSDFKARHSQANSTEEIRGYDRGLLNHKFGRSRATSRQSQITRAESRASKISKPHSRVLHRVCFWWQRSEVWLRSWSVRH